MSFTLVGSTFFPSAAYALIDGYSIGEISIAGLGLSPQDGFSEYKSFSAPGQPRPRWGDYGAAVTDGDTIWFAAEYIGQSCTFDQYNIDLTCGGTRGALGNWATRISAIRP
jgi:hypothetical protein